MAGPWFAVLKAGDSWKPLGETWISNGVSNERAQVEIRVSWKETQDDA
ncbi:MAG: hypothetical protein O7H41_06780 [Planctomycetota bacterium]|nr:hypothetical protein [Planctomycetota bacterium]